MLNKGAGNSPSVRIAQKRASSSPRANKQDIRRRKERGCQADRMKLLCVTPERLR